MSDDGCLPAVLIAILVIALFSSLVYVESNEFSVSEITECRANLEWCAKEKPRLYKALTRALKGDPS